MLRCMTLAEYLARNDLKAAELATRIGVSRQALSRYIKGERRPEWTLLRRITEATDGHVTANDFVPETAA